MPRLLKQSTAFTFRIGPFVDDTDFKTAETGLTIAQADIQISKAGGAFAQTSDAAPTTTHDADAWYQCPLTTTDTGTLGALTVQIAVAGALPVWEHFMVVPANVYDSLVSGSDLLDANASQLGGTSQTGRDVGASVLLSPGSGAGQLDITSGVVKSNLAQILGTALTETAGYLAAGFKKLFNVASPVMTMENINQTGDSYGRLGAPAGASIAADIAALNNLSSDDVNAAVDSALNTAIPAEPTADSINERVKTLDDNYTAARAGHLDKLNVSGTLAHSDAAASYKADVSNLDATVSSRSTHAAADVVTAWLAKTGWTTGGTTSLETAMKALLSMAKGKVTKVGNAYAFLDDDDTTTLFTLTIGDTTRTPS